MSESDNFRKHSLECMRLAAECTQLVGDIHIPSLQRHFLRMAKVWTSQAKRGPGADAQTKNYTKRAYAAQARISRRQPPTLLH